MKLDRKFHWEDRMPRSSSTYPMRCLEEWQILSSWSSINSSEVNEFRARNTQFQRIVVVELISWIFQPSISSIWILLIFPAFRGCLSDHNFRSKLFRVVSTTASPSLTGARSSSLGVDEVEIPLWRVTYACERYEMLLRKIPRQIPSVLRASYSVSAQSNWISLNRKPIDHEGET